MEITRLKEKYVDIAKKDEELIGLIAKAARRSSYRVKLWLKGNHEFLTTANVLNTISKYLKVSVKSLTEQVLIEEEIT